MVQILEAFVGLQWGDEGKGKIVDERVVYAKNLNDDQRTVVVRYQGGSNAGHSVYARNKEGRLVPFVTHAAPTGITNNADIAIGPHVAFNPKKFQEEMALARQTFGYDGKVMISERVGILFDYHVEIDESRETQGNGAEVGSTKQGIGPFYEDNARRTTRITFADYVSSRFPDRLRQVLLLKRQELEVAGIAVKDYAEKLIAEHNPIRENLIWFAEALEYRLRDYLTQGHHIIIEGAQGTGLDVDMGTIPDQTSSHLLAPHAFPTLGLPRRSFRIYGVEKVYPSRVGKGEMPSLALDDFGKTLPGQAGEFGATTKRPRRVGYPDWVQVRRAVMINDCDGVFLMRADNVQNRDLRVCTGYKLPGERGIVTEEVPLSLTGVEPVYGDRTYRWQFWEGNENLSDPLKVDDELKTIRQGYVERGFGGLPGDLPVFMIAHDEFVRCPTVGVSIGPGRGETVYNKGLIEA